MTYTIRLKDLELQTTIGVYDWERTAPRPLVLQVELQVAAPNAAKSDAVQDTVDYALIESTLLDHAANTAFQLLEAFVSVACQRVLALDARIHHVTIEADKPGILKHARSVSVSASAGR